MTAGLQSRLSYCKEAKKFHPSTFFPLQKNTYFDKVSLQGSKCSFQNYSCVFKRIITNEQQSTLAPLVITLLTNLIKRCLGFFPSTIHNIPSFLTKKTLRHTLCQHCTAKTHQRKKKKQCLPTAKNTGYSESNASYLFSKKTQHIQRAQ